MGLRTDGRAGGRVNRIRIQSSRFPSAPRKNTLCGRYRNTHIPVHTFCVIFLFLLLHFGLSNPPLLLLVLQVGAQDMITQSFCSDKLFKLIFSCYIPSMTLWLSTLYCDRVLRNQKKTLLYAKSRPDEMLRKRRDRGLSAPALTTYTYALLKHKTVASTSKEPYLAMAHKQEQSTSSMRSSTQALIFPLFSEPPNSKLHSVYTPK